MNSFATKTMLGNYPVTLKNKKNKMLKAYYIHASIQCGHTIVIYIGLTTINKCFFIFFIFGRERYSLHKCNDNNLKEM